MKAVDSFKFSLFAVDARRKTRHTTLNHTITMTTLPLCPVMHAIPPLLLLNAEFLNAFRTSCFVLMLVEACGMLLRARRTRQSTAAHRAQSQSTNDEVVHQFHRAVMIVSLCLCIIVISVCVYAASGPRPTQNCSRDSA